MQVGRRPLLHQARELYPVTVLDPIVRIWASYETGLRHLATGRELLIKGEPGFYVSYIGCKYHPIWLDEMSSLKE